MLKKFLALFVSFIIFMTSSFSTYLLKSTSKLQSSKFSDSQVTKAQELNNTSDQETIIIKLQIGNTIMSVNDKAILLDAPPEIKNGRTFLPIRAISEAFGAIVTWTGETRCVTVTLNDNRILLYIGNTSVMVNGSIVIIEAAPYIKNSRTMVPLRVIAEGLNSAVEWDSITKTVTITYINKTLPNDSVSKEINASTGGIVELTNGAKVEIPPNALDKDSVITVQIVERPDKNEPKVFTIGNVYEISVKGGDLQKDAKLELPIPLNYKNKNVMIASWNGKIWIFKGGNKVNDKLILNVEHFSTYAIVEFGEASTNFSFDKFSWKFDNIGVSDTIDGINYSHPGGICYGLVAVAGKTYQLSKNNNFIYQLPQYEDFYCLNNEWRKYIYKAFDEQSKHEEKYKIKNQLTLYPEEMSEIYNEISNGNPVVIGMGVWKRLDNGKYVYNSGHAVLAYKIEPSSIENHFLIHIYDPNHPIKVCAGDNKFYVYDRTISVAKYTDENGKISFEPAAYDLGNGSGNDMGYTFVAISIDSLEINNDNLINLLKNEKPTCLSPYPFSLSINYQPGIDELKNGDKFTLKIELVNECDSCNEVRLQEIGIKKLDKTIFDFDYAKNNNKSLIVQEYGSGDKFEITLPATSFKKSLIISINMKVNDKKENKIVVYYLTQHLCVYSKEVKLFSEKENHGCGSSYEVKFRGTVISFVGRVGDCNKQGPYDYAVVSIEEVIKSCPRFDDYIKEMGGFSNKPEIKVLIFDDTETGPPCDIRGKIDKLAVGDKVEVFGQYFDSYGPPYTTGCDYIEPCDCMNYYVKKIEENKSEVLQLSITVDKGCGATYNIGDPIRIYIKSNQSGTAYIIDKLGDGSSQELGPYSLSANVTRSIDGKIGPPTGTETLILQFTSSSGKYGEAQCSFTVGGSGPVDLQLSITVDKGCGATYYVNDPIRIYVSSNQSGTGYIVNYKSDGSVMKIGPFSLDANVRGYIDGTIGLPAGTRTLVLQFTSLSGKYGEAQCSFTVGGSTLPTVRLTYPNGGETLTAGTTINVTWTISGDLSKVQRIDFDYSTNNGANWSRDFSVNSGFSASMSSPWVVPNVQSTQCLFRATLTRTDTTTHVDYSDSTFSITTGGNGTWVPVNNGLTNAYVYSLAIDPTNTQAIYAGTDGGGVFKSTNGGSTWSAINNGLTDSYVCSLAIDPSNTQVIYAGTGGGVFKSTNGGSSWSAINSGLTNTNVSSLSIDPTNTNIIYAGTWGGVLKSTNGGTSWTQINNGLTNTHVESLSIDPTNTNIIYAGTYGGVFKSTDSGANWTQINNGLTNTYVYSLSIDPKNTNIIYAGTEDGGVFKSTNGGASWTPINNGLTYTDVCSLAIDPTNTQIIYAGTWGGGVFKWNP